MILCEPFKEVRTRTNTSFLSNYIHPAMDLFHPLFSIREKKAKEVCKENYLFDM